MVWGASHKMWIVGDIFRTVAKVPKILRLTDSRSSRIGIFRYGEPPVKACAGPLKSEIFRGFSGGFSRVSVTG